MITCNYLTLLYLLFLYSKKCLWFQRRFIIREIIALMKRKTLLWIVVLTVELSLRNRKQFPCFHTVIETRVEVWENEKLKWEYEPVGRVFPRNFEFSQTSTSVSRAYGDTENVFYFVYKITRSFLYRSVNSPYCSWWRMRWRIMAHSIPTNFMTTTNQKH